MKRLVITGTGACIPALIKRNHDFSENVFFDTNQVQFEQESSVLIGKFADITGIAERRYLNSELNASDLAIVAAQEALEHADADPETIDLILVAHNFGNVLTDTIQSDAVPSLANRVKNALKIKNPNCVAFDILFGCPGWVHALQVANTIYGVRPHSKCLIIGAETLSRVVDIYDRDSMIFADGAGAFLMETTETSPPGPGILGGCSQSFSTEELEYINMGKSFLPGSDEQVRYIKMQGRRVYEFAMKHVPVAMKKCLDDSGVDIRDLKKIFLHQANEKMDDGILNRFYQLYQINEPPLNIMPMTIHWLGNSSVATVPTLFHLVKQGLIDNHAVRTGDVVLFASVGAGMNISAVCYRC